MQQQQHLVHHSTGWELGSCPRGQASTLQQLSSLQAAPALACITALRHTARPGGVKVSAVGNPACHVDADCQLHIAALPAKQNLWPHGRGQHDQTSLTWQ